MEPNHEEIFISGTFRNQESTVPVSSYYSAQYVFLFFEGYLPVNTLFLLKTK